MPKDQALTAAPGEDDSSEARLEYPVLSSTADQRIPAHTKVDNEESFSAEQLATQEQGKKRKSRATTKANTNSKLLAP